MKHYIITRVDIPQRLNKDIYSEVDPGIDFEWTRKRIELMQKGVINQLQKQTNKEFFHILLFRKESIIHKELINSLPAHSFFIGFEDYEPITDEEHAEVKFMEGHLGGHIAIRDLLNELDCLKYEDIIVTNVDSDDSIPIDFVQKIQECYRYHINKPRPFYIDVQGVFRLHEKTGNVGYRQTKSCSMFTSVVENHACLKLPYYIFGHSALHKHIKGYKMPGVYGCMLIHDQNIMTKSLGDRNFTGTFKKEDYYG